MCGRDESCSENTSFVAPGVATEEGKEQRGIKGSGRGVRMEDMEGMRRVEVQVRR